MKEKASFEELLSINSSVKIPQNKFDLHKGVILLRKLLMSGDKLTIQKVIDLNLIGSLLAMMSNSSEPHLQFESAWCIASLATGNSSQVESMVSKGLFRCLQIVLNHPSEKIAEQGSWIVANVSSEDISYKRDMIKAGIASVLTQKILQTTDVKILKYTTWALSTLVQGPRFHPTQRESCVPFVKNLLTCNDVEILSHSLTALASLIDMEVLVLFKTGQTLRRIHEISQLKYDSILSPIINILQHFSSAAGVEFTEEIVKYGFIDKIFEWLGDKTLSEKLKLKLLFILSNITMGPDPHIGAVLKTKQNFTLLMSFCFSDNIEFRKEGCFVIGGITNQGTFRRIEGLLANNVLDMIINNLQYKGHDDSLVLFLLLALDNILSSVYKMNDCVLPDELLLKIEDLGYYEILEKLMNNDNNDIYEKAYKIGNEYFETED